MAMLPQWAIFDAARVGIDSPCNYLSALRFFALRAALNPVATSLKGLASARIACPRGKLLTDQASSHRARPVHRSITKSRSGGAAKTG